MTLEPNHMAIAKAENTNVLIYLGRLFNDPVLKIFAPLVAVISMTGACLSSFFGAKESVIGLIEQKLHQHKLQSNKLNYIAIALILIPCYILCILDTSILNLMSLLVGPVVALLLFIFPIYAVYTIPNLKKYHVTTFDKLKNYYVLLIGIIAFSAILYSFKYLLSYAS
jgi:serine transporter